MSKRIAFTLAEIMIVLAVIGVLTAVLLPVAINSTPNENVMKFKKGHNALLTTIRELVSSDKYYLDGDLGVRADGTLIDGTHDGDDTYFCNSIADIVGAKNVDCSDSGKLIGAWEDMDAVSDFKDVQLNLDSSCKTVNNKIGVTTEDGIVFFDYATKILFGMSIKVAQTDSMYGSPADSNNRNFGEYKINGFDVIYKTFCMDIDGIDNGEDPFGYGIRADGKVLLGARAEQWLQKSIQEKE